MFQYPETAEQRKVGMAAFRARMLAAQERILATQKLSKRESEAIESYIASIKDAQRKYGEI